MKKYYGIRNQQLVPADADQGCIIIFADPDGAEKKGLLDVYDIDNHTLESSLDVDEIARVEFENEHLFVIWKKPKTFKFTGQLSFGMTSMGISLWRDKLILITDEPAGLLEGKPFQRVSSLGDVVLKVMLQTVHHFLGHLKAVKQIHADIQKKLNYSLENAYLLQMFSLSETLIYYLDAMEGNGAVLTRLRTACETQKLSLAPAEIELLDDIIIDNQQSAKQAQIYSSVLSGLMDARGNIVNNNMNVLLKNLTLINVVFLPLNLIASIGGMSEYSMMTHGLDWRVAYALFMVSMAALAWATWIYLRRRISIAQTTPPVKKPRA